MNAKSNLSSSLESKIKNIVKRHYKSEKSAELIEYDITNLTSFHMEGFIQMNTKSFEMSLPVVGSYIKLTHGNYHCLIIGYTKQSVLSKLVTISNGVGIKLGSSIYTILSFMFTKNGLAIALLSFVYWKLGNWVNSTFTVGRIFLGVGKTFNGVGYYADKGLQGIEYGIDEFNKLSLKETYQNINYGLNSGLNNTINGLNNTIIRFGALKNNEKENIIFTPAAISIATFFYWMRANQGGGFVKIG